MGGLSDITGRAPCYPAFSQVIRLRRCRRDGVNFGRAAALAGPDQIESIVQASATEVESIIRKRWKSTLRRGARKVRSESLKGFRRCGESEEVRHVLQKALKLRELIARYGAMRRLDGFTPHSRGTELNRLIADGLDCYGIRANASARQGYGEIDVTFAVEGTRLVLEAKWEQDKTDTGKISKLKTRVEQRLTNTVGVFMSMAGYSPEAIRDVNIGRRLEVLLIDRSHLEAMISGVVPPTELFGLLIDKASYEGRPYYALEELLPRPAAEPVVGFGAPEGLDDLVRTARPGVVIEPLLHDLPMESIGLASLAANELILNYSEGLVRVDLGRQAAEWHAALPTSYGHTLPMGDGLLLFRRSPASVRCATGKYTASPGDSSATRSSSATKTATRGRSTMAATRTTTGLKRV
jgi:Holliday junction resolvase-like predicted endonuclease